MDSTIVREAQLQGIERLHIVLPPNAPSEPDEVLLRVVVRKVPQNATVPTNNRDIAINSTFIN